MSSVSRATSNSISKNDDTWFGILSSFFRLPTSSTEIIASVIGGVTLMGATTYFIYSKIRKARNEDNDEQSLYAQQAKQLHHALRDRNGRRDVRRNEVPPPLVTFVDLYERASVLARQIQQRRKVKLYFDSNDEFVTEEAIPEVLESDYNSNMLELANESEDEEQQKKGEEEDRLMLEVVNRKYHSVLVHFGNEELHLTGTTKITRSIFEGSTDKTENALLFLENLDKIKSNPKQKQRKNKSSKAANSARRGDFMSQSDGNTAPLTDDFDGYSDVLPYGAPEVYNSDSEMSEDDTPVGEVLLNISPQKFEKPKDSLFIDFFSMYTKKFVEEEATGSKKERMQYKSASKMKLESMPISNQQQQQADRRRGVLQV